MTKKRPYTKAVRGALMRAWFQNPENMERHKAAQRKRFQTEQGKAHQARMCKAAADARRINPVIPPEMRTWNDAMARKGIPAAKRIAIIAAKRKQPMAGTVERRT
jgi:hypothetical protein